MKKTLTVNLNGMVYSIDEDAYLLLDNYINNLRYLFRKDNDAEEIMRDMEARMAELFNEYLCSGREVVTVKEIEEVIERMGKPEDLNEDILYREKDDTADGRNKVKGNNEDRKKHCLYRNPDDRILGGVLSGLSIYLGWEVTWVRIGTFIAGCLINELILIYLVAWLIIPLAQTATEKLQMRGEAINMENIGKTVTGRFEKVNNMYSTHFYSTVHRLGSRLIMILGLIIKVILAAMAVIFIPVLLFGLLGLFGVLVAVIGFLVNGWSIIYHVIPTVDWLIVTSSPIALIILILCGILVVGIPVYGMLSFFMHMLKVGKPTAVLVRVILVFVWLLAMVTGICLLWNLFHPYYI